MDLLDIDLSMALHEQLGLQIGPCGFLKPSWVIANSLVHSEQIQRISNLRRAIGDMSKRSKRATKSKTGGLPVPISEESKILTGSKYEPDYELFMWDMDPKFGPSKGLTRLERWQRAKYLGLDPPESIYVKLQKNPYQSGIWEDV